MGKLLLDYILPLHYNPLKFFALCLAPALS
jgi:hypothetical protein